ncbi:MAG: Ger(x)C family spore germination C-terminal domain-containing protein [Bacillota bacterium]|nr:Ger(x)C family spore germination C-terminal domain-containing protein [Bacillota bacterium]
MQTSGSIFQQQGKMLDLSDPKSVTQLENLFSQTIKQQVEDAIAKAQQDFEADYLGIGLALKRRKPAEFKTLNWDETFPNVPINVEVESMITGSGLSP